MNGFTHVHNFHKLSHLVLKRLNTTTCDLHGDLSMQSTASEAWPHKPCKLKVINPSCLHIDCILPKRPYLPCLRMADRALLAGYPRYNMHHLFRYIFLHVCPTYFRRTLTTWGLAQDKQKEQQHHAMHSLNTLRPRQMDAISKTTFSNAFSWMKMFEYRLKFHGNLFLRIRSTIL